MFKVVQKKNKAEVIYEEREAHFFLMKAMINEEH